MAKCNNNVHPETNERYDKYICNKYSTRWNRAKRNLLLCNSIFDHSFFVLLQDYVIMNGRGIPKTDLNFLLRKCDDKLIARDGAMLSENAKKEYGGIVEVKEGLAKPKGLWMEHIIPVGERLDMLIDMYKYKTQLREDLDKFIVDTFYGVYKLKSEDPEEYEAESLLSKKNQQKDKVKKFLELKKEYMI